MMNRILTILMVAMALWAVPFGVKADDDKVEQHMFEAMQKDDKAVVVAVHFGTSEASAQGTIDRFNARLRAAYPDCDFREAWTSRIIIKKLAKQGKNILTPDQLLSELEKQGYTHVLIQSSNIIDGIEMQYLRYLIESVKTKFKQIRLGEPLLHSIEDYEQALSAAMTAYGREKEVNILVCHGSKGAINAQYTMLDYMAGAKGYENCYVFTIEGYPTLDNVVSTLNKQKSMKKKKLNLIPFMFVAGDHAKNDIAQDLPNELKKAGYQASATVHSLGEIDAILDIYVAHAKEAEKYYKYTIKELKMRAAAK